MTSPAPPFAEPAVVRAHALLAEGREAEALALLERHPSPAADALHCQIATRAATAAVQYHDVAAACAWLDRGLARAPGDATLNFFRGNLHLDAGRPAEAVACLQRSVAAEPGREEFVCHLGRALIAAGRAAEAAAFLAPWSGSARAQAARGTACAQLGDWTAAAEALANASRLQPDHFEAWHHLGLARQRLGEWPASLVAFNRAVALRPTDPAAHVARGATLVALGQPAAAAAAFEQPCVSTPGIRKPSGPCKRPAASRRHHKAVKDSGAADAVLRTAPGLLCSRQAPRSGPPIPFPRPAGAAHHLHRHSRMNRILSLGGLAASWCCCSSPACILSRITCDGKRTG